MTAKQDAAAKSAVEKAVEAEELSVFESLAALGPAAEVGIFREPGQKYLEQVSVDGLDLDMMRERYGGGKFSLRARMDGNFIKGQKVRHVVIEGAPKLFPPVPAGTDPVAAVEIARMRGELETLKVKTGGGDSGAALAIVTLLAPAVTALLESLMHRPPPPDPMLMLGEFRKMVRDDRKDVAAASGEEGGWTQLVDKLGIPMLGEITKLRKIEEGKKVDAPEQIAAPAPKPSTYPELAQFIARWCAQPCARGTNPALRAELFLEELSLQENELYASVVNLARQENILDQWIKLVPEVGLNREWHGTFINEIRLLADESEAAGSEGDSPPDPEGGRGDDGNAPGDDEAGDAGSAE